jgi:hypothetical protein
MGPRVETMQMMVVMVVMVTKPRRAAARLRCSGSKGKIPKIKKLELLSPQVLIGPLGRSALDSQLSRPGW